MLGNIQEVRSAYLETVTALRNRTLSPADLATQVRLSKTPETYYASRSTHQEPAYEALIRAGRTYWHPGERVRFYRTSGKGYIWLPDENEEASVSNGWRTGSDGERQSNNPGEEVRRTDLIERRDYDVEYYIRLLTSSYAARLRKAFAPSDFEQLFRSNTQLTLFDMDQPIEDIQPLWIRCS